MNRTLGGFLLLFALGCVSSAPSPTTAPVTAKGSAASSDRQVMVTYKPAPPALWSNTTLELEQTYRLRTVFAWTMASLGEQCVVFEIPRDRSRDEILRRLRADPRVGTAQVIATFDALADPPASPAYNDPYAHLQRSIHVLTLEKAHRWATGKGVRVAVIDTGIDVDHPDLRGRIAKVGNFVERGEQGFTSDIHGTAVAGVIAAATNNQVGIVGVAPQAEIFALKACWPKRPGTREAVCDSYTLARAIDFAIVQGAQILNFSLAGAAQVSGIAALLLEREPRLAPARLADLLRRTARASEAALAQVDACAALAGALGQGGCG